jgi:hypothetical protein
MHHLLSFASPSHPLHLSFTSTPSHHTSSHATSPHPSSPFLTPSLLSHPLSLRLTLSHSSPAGVVEPVYSKFSENGSVSTSGHTTEGSVSSSLSPSRASTFKVLTILLYCTLGLLFTILTNKCYSAAPLARLDCLVTEALPSRLHEYCLKILHQPRISRLLLHPV